VALLLAAFGALAAFYAAAIAAGWLPFNAGAWIVGEPMAMRGWIAYALLALAYGAAAAGLWRGSSWARWPAIVLLGYGLLPALPGISSAAAELRIGGIALWGASIIVRSAALYSLFSAQ
jgi:hypothetical protein